MGYRYNTQAWPVVHFEFIGRLTFVVRSTLIRGLVRAVMHFQDLPVSHEWFAALDEAMTWAAARANGQRSLRP